ncbi:hypothetical protein [Leisingera sp.]|jgi:hypothetical protein
MSFVKQFTVPDPADPQHLQFLQKSPAELVILFANCSAGAG